MHRLFDPVSVSAGSLALPRRLPLRPSVPAPRAADPLPPRYEQHARAPQTGKPPAERVLEGEWLPPDTLPARRRVTTPSRAAVLEAPPARDPSSHAAPLSSPGARIYTTVQEASAAVERRGALLDLYA